jgi:glycosyltransferase involved in cell wall biosynthesis
MVRTGISGIRELDNYVKDIANIYDYIMPITTYLSSMYRRNGRRKPIFLNPIIVNTAEFSFVKNAKFQSVRNLLYCGNLDHAREMELLVKSFSLVVKHKSDLKLRIVGGYSSIRKAHQKHSKLKSLCSKLGINDSVIFTGNISHSSVLKHYAGSDMFLLPRPYEAYSLAGFPSKLGEYLASGKPVVTTGTGDIPMYLEDGHTAYIVDMDNESAFSEKIATAIEDDRSNEIGAAGAEAAEKYFSIQATTRRISNFFVNTLCM